ncbi:MAG: GAF domain-containing protein, partial [Cystobacter sp.]
MAIPGLFAALLAVGLFWRQARLATRDATHDEAMVLAEFMEASFRLTTPAGQPPHSPVAELLASKTRLLDSTAELNVLSPDGRILWSTQPREVGLRHPAAALLTAPGPQWARSDAHQTEVLRPLGNSTCEGCHAGASERPLGMLHVRAAEPEVHRELTDALMGALVAVFVLGALLILATATSLHFFLVRPLRRLMAAMRRAEEGDLLVRAEAGDSDELARLGSAFNAMLAHLTSMKAEEIDTHRDLQETRLKLSIKGQLEERVTELGLLFDVAHSVNSTLELSELLVRITQLVPERLHIPDFSIMLVNAEGLLEIKSTFPANPALVGMTFRLDEGVCGRAAATQRGVYIPDVSEATSPYVRREPRSLNEHGAMLCLPMVHTDTVLGVLNFQRPEVASFAPQELELLTAVADQAATAVKNALLHTEAVRLTLTDPLTGVPNRRHLFSRLELEVARAQRFGSHVSILMVDIDHFKKLN